MLKMYVLVNSDLNMSIGKACAQVAHAVARLRCPKAPYSVVVLSATTEQLHNVDTYLTKLDAGKPEGRHFLYIDEGSHETPPFSATALAVRPLDTFDDDETVELFRDFDKLRAPRRWWKAYDF